jgi:hypothetical protein
MVLLVLVAGWLAGTVALVAVAAKRAAPGPSTVLMVLLVLVAGWLAGAVALVAVAAKRAAPGPSTVLMVLVLVAGRLAGTV